MKNEWINRFKNTITVKIRGKNIERFLKRLVSLKIDLLKIQKIKYNEMLIRINKEDYKRLEEVKTIYEIEIIAVHGMNRIKNILFKNKYVIFSLLFSVIILLCLCNTIFSVEVIHNNPELREIILKELKDNGIDRFHSKKNYQQLQKIKKSILNEYKDKIEWLEIEERGTKYIVRVEERIITKEDNSYMKRDIVAAKDAFLTKIMAEEGEIVVPRNSYVKKGDTIITGNIKLYENIKEQIMAKGEIFGEVWYKVTVEYPLKYYEEIPTGKKNKAIVLKFLNHEIEIFNFHKFKHKKVKEKKLISHLFLPFELVIQSQSEVNIIDQNLTDDEAIDQAVQKAKDKIINQLKEKEYIIDAKKLKVEKNNSKIIVEVFISVCENITDYKEIIEMEPIEE